MNALRGIFLFVIILIFDFIESIELFSYFYHIVIAYAYSANVVLNRAVLILYV